MLVNGPRIILDYKRQRINPVVHWCRSNVTAASPLNLWASLSSHTQEAGTSSSTRYPMQRHSQPSKKVQKNPLFFFKFYFLFQFSCGCFLILKKIFPWKFQPKEQKEWLGVSFKPENFIPGVVIGFILGLLLDWSKPPSPSNNNSPTSSSLTRKSRLLSKYQQEKIMSPGAANSDGELKMVSFVGFW